MHCRTRLRAITAPVAITVAGATAIMGALNPVDASAATGGDSPRPNLVFILADDLGWADLSTGRVNGGHGHDFNETPALDRLAEEGQVFTEAYATPQCSPTRAALHTGQFATRPTNNVYAVSSIKGDASKPLRGVRQGRLAEDGKNAVPKSHVTVAETLQKAGYKTGYVGKFHVNGTPGEVVSYHGYDEAWGAEPRASTTDYFARDGRFNDSIEPNMDNFAAPYSAEYVAQNIAPYSHGVTAERLEALEGTDKHLTDALTDATLDFIDRRKDEPFFTWVGHFAPHFPVNDAQARPDLLAKYKAKPRGEDPSKPSYAAMVEGVDQSVARIVDYLESTPDPRNEGRPLAENTLLIFASDNGGKISTGSHNGPLRGEKRQPFEGGVRVPWIAWSGSDDLVLGGRVNKTLVDSTDLYKTLASYAGAPLPAGVPLDGQDLRPSISKGVHVDRRVYYHQPGYRGREVPVSTVRDGDWKLYYWYEDRSFSLYNLKRDIGETTDRAKDRPKTRRRLGRILLRWMRDTRAPLAKVRPGHRKVVVKRFTGRTYAEGKVRRHYRARLVFKPGQVVPYLLPEPPTAKQKAAAKKARQAKKAAAKAKKKAKKQQRRG